MSYYDDDDNDMDADYDNDMDEEVSDDEDVGDLPEVNASKILGRFQKTAKPMLPKPEDVEEEEEEGDGEDPEEGEEGEEEEEGNEEEGDGEEDEGTVASQLGGADMSSASALEIQKRIGSISDDEDDDDSDYGDKYLERMDVALNTSTLELCHPECRSLSATEVEALVRVVRDANGMIIDPLHQTIPVLTKYEKAKVLGQRAVQLNAGAVPFIKVPENIIDGYEIAKLELEAKRIPFILSRIFPNGSFELWNVNDLENINY